MAISEGSGSKASVAGSAVTPDDAAAAASPSNLFVRKSSGLVRELGIRDAFAFNLAGVNPTGLGFALLFILGGFPGTDITWPLLITLAGAIVLSLTYAQLLSSMPRSGADFIYTSRIYSPGIGAAVGMAFFFSVIIGFGVVTEQLAAVYFPNVFLTFGTVFHSNALVTFAGTLGEKGWTIGTATVLILITGYFLLKRVHLMARATLWLVLFGCVAFVVMLAELLFHSQAGFEHAFNAHLHNSLAYRQIIATSIKNGGRVGVTAAATFASVALVWQLFGGVQYANYTGGELRRPGWTFRAATIAAVVIEFLLMLLAWLLVKHTLGLHFIQGASYLNSSDPAAYSKIAGDVTGYLPSYVALVASDPVSKIVISLGFFLGLLSLIFATAVVLSRLIFALSFDRVLPPSLADVGEKTHAPVKAAMVVMMLGVGAVLLVLYTSVLSATRNFSLILELIYAFVSLAAAILPFRRRDLYDMSPKMLGNRWLGIPVITIVGAVSCVYWAVVLYLGATKTQVSGGYDATSLISLAIALFGGFIVYGIARASLRRKGLDLSQAIHELPPE